MLGRYKSADRSPDHSATITALGNRSEPTAPANLGEARVVVRLPIFDKIRRVHGYELLFHSDADAARGGNGSLAASTILDDAVIFGVDQFTNGLPAFVKCTAETLTKELTSLLPTQKVVLEISESLELPPALIEECRTLKKAGFRLALDNFTGHAPQHSLLPLADYVKVNIAHTPTAECQRIRQQLQGTSIAMVAVEVETQEDYRRAVGDGFTFFEGNYFCQEEMIHRSKVPSNRLFHLDILRQLQEDPLLLKKIAPLVMRDASLTYRLLRMANSPVFAIRRDVRSIEAAIMLVGETVFRKIATLAILSEINSDQTPEILHTALVRARFCEQAAKSCGLNPNEQYLLGMLSLLPAMMGSPMEDLVRELPLRKEICEALLGTDNRERCLLAWMECNQRNDRAAWNAVADKYRLDKWKLSQEYFDAVVWEAELRPSI